MSKHTPSPWDGKCIGVMNTHKVGFSLEFVYSSLPKAREVCEANASLIKAAPELLEACIKANRFLADCARQGGMYDVDKWAEVQHSLHNAAKKAKGE